MQRLTITHWLGIWVVALAALALLIWVPNDTVSGFMQTKRGRVSIGDAMAPAVAFGLMVFSGILIFLEGRKPAEENRDRSSNPGYLVVVLAICLMAIGAMIWTGPFAVTIFDSDESYRNLRDDAPWKYLGFGLGGTLLVSALIGFVEHRLSVRAVLIGLATVAILVGVFDLAFDNLLLPPNGDQ